MHPKSFLSNFWGALQMFGHPRYILRINYQQYLKMNLYIIGNIISDLLNCKKQSRQMPLYYFKNFFRVNR